MQICCKIFLLLLILSPILSKSITDEELSLSRVVNGYMVDISEVPYQAALRRRVTSGWAHMCGAVIITVRALLTASHCVSFYVEVPSNLRVVTDTSSRLTGGKSYDVTKIYVHELYESATLENDIAMVVTSKKMTFSQNANPVALAPENVDLPAGSEAIVSGFGTTSFEGSVSSVLMAAKVNILAHEVCARAYLRIASISEGMICANATNPPRDACLGDSGGPLVANQVLVGIVSWGEGCADTVYPGVYIRISEYNEWIHDKLGDIWRYIF